jgi:hypothetical protein
MLGLSLFDADSPGGPPSSRNPRISRSFLFVVISHSSGGPSQVAPPKDRVGASRK